VKAVRGYIASMHVNLLAFAQARDQLGWAELVVECEPDETPRTVFGRVAPDLRIEMMRVAVDQEYQSWDEPIGEADEIALIPPVSGG
jgi:sulfur-carrier protein